MRAAVLPISHGAVAEDVAGDLSIMPISGANHDSSAICCSWVAGARAVSEYGRQHARESWLVRIRRRLAP